ncbi:hypothetical protein HPB47_022123 [Ixodes persulcatus]|uniref:Uncharacterized protein n=1 Tax=Ixodes persulcatus TaxID=34615 RepID=A0AC60QCX3_IXOPE|nr:hypothetical protein HPB47_022123 [Ixodes persulcatus]
MAAGTEFDPATHWFPEWDHRTRGWAMCGNPVPLVVLCVIYVYLVKQWGPKWMSEKKPFEIRGVMVAYNFTLVLVNACLVLSLVRYGYVEKRYSLLGQGPDFATDSVSLLIVRLSWWYYVLRLFEFLDTVFFVLRKKYAQISALHVFHHVVVAWNMWMNLTYGGQAQTLFVMVVNSSVHVVMYTYYFVSALGPAFEKYIWWKRYLTQLQLAQFTVVFAHSSSYLFYKDNAIPGFTVIMTAEAVVFFLWFMSFYAHAYRKAGRNAFKKVRNSAAAASEALAKVATSCSPDQAKCD